MAPCWRDTLTVLNITWNIFSWIFRPGILNLFSKLILSHTLTLQGYKDVDLTEVNRKQSSNVWWELTLLEKKLKVFWMWATILASPKLVALINFSWSFHFVLIKDQNNKVRIILIWLSFMIYKEIIQGIQ